MKKIGRNDACPCESGKKYKKCHGIANVLEISPEPYNLELEKLQKGLADFALQTYGKELDGGLRAFPWPAPETPQHVQDVFIMGLSAWFMVNKRLAHGETIAATYVKQEKGKIKQARVKNKLIAWSHVSPSLYAIESITAEFIHLRNTRTDERYSMKNSQQRQVQAGDYLFGILLPFVKQHEPLLSMVEVAKADTPFIRKITLMDEADLLASYPTLLLEQIDPTQQNAEIVYEWKKPIYEVVMQLFIEEMTAKKADQKLTEAGISIWHTFANQNEPNFQKPSGFAAAMEYIVYDFYNQLARPSQTELAARYQISVNTVKRNVEKFYLFHESDPDNSTFIPEKNKAIQDYVKTKVVL